MIEIDFILTCKTVPKVFIELASKLIDDQSGPISLIRKRTEIADVIESTTWNSVTT